LEHNQQLFYEAYAESKDTSRVSQ